MQIINIRCLTFSLLHLGYSNRFQQALELIAGGKSDYHAALISERIPNQVGEKATATGLSLLKKLKLATHTKKHQKNERRCG